MENNRRKFITASAAPLALGLVASQNSYGRPPARNATIPSLVIELGNNGQANGGLGIDKGSYYQIDCHIGVTPYNEFGYSINPDGTISLTQDGTYFVASSANILPLNRARDAYQLPAQVTLAIGATSHPWPGTYQYAVQYFPGPPSSIAAIVPTLTSGLGSISMTGPMIHWSASTALWLGYSKVLGLENGLPLSLQGYLIIQKIA
ncbi:MULTISPECIES: hypothetical protein [unclassified Burkholderia]|uniref:hypothetical protein n=1 Tax=unclassified Burkholderia TaxID=2613784 RepID=UPI002AB0E309|nr:MULTISPECIES: hypothetical protein [unclassified Burkholderia]